MHACPRRARPALSAVIGGMLIAGALAGGCTKNTTTGRSQLHLIDRDDELAIGATQGPELTKEFGGEVPNANLRNYVTEVGMKLKDQTEGDGPQRTWVFTLLDSDVINAFALPGERVFMSRGLADQMTNEAQLAGVLGHEIGHVMARHSSERMSQSVGAGLLAGIAGVVAGVTVKDSTLAGLVPQVVGAGGQVVVLKFSREQESEADALGMRYMTRAGYNPRGQLQVMEILDRASKASGGGGGPEWLATHPLPATRIREVQEALNTQYAYTQTGPDADKHQFFPERFKQRYLDIRATEPKKAPAPKKKAAVDGNGRTRMLAAVDLEHPITWCGVCQVQLAMTLPAVDF